MCLDIYYSLYTNTFTCANLFLHVCASCEGCSSTRRVSKQCFVMELFLFNLNLEPKNNVLDSSG